MKYALFIYGDEAWEHMSGNARRDFHLVQRAHHRAHRRSAGGNAAVIGHYRLRSADKALTIGLIGADVRATEGPAVETHRLLRALYLVESEAEDAVRDFAASHPVVRMGGSIEIWPLIEPDLHDGRAADPSETRPREAA